MTDNPHRQVSAVTPAHHAQALRIADASLDEHVNACHDIVHVAEALRLNSRYAEFRPVVDAAPKIGFKHGEALLEKYLSGICARDREILERHARWTSMQAHQQRDSR